MYKKCLFTLFILMAFFMASYEFSIAKDNDIVIKAGSIKLDDVDEVKFPDMAKISFQKAMENALTKFPGKLLSVELKEEDGYLIYEVEVVNKQNEIVEVYVDAGNGNILGSEMDKEDKEKEGEKED